jgi:hypothetical protein
MEMTTAVLTKVNVTLMSAKNKSFTTFAKAVKLRSCLLSLQRVLVPLAHKSLFYLVVTYTKLLYFIALFLF